MENEWVYSYDAETICCQIVAHGEGVKPIQLQLLNSLNVFLKVCISPERTLCTNEFMMAQKCTRTKFLLTSPMYFQDL